VLQSNYSHNTLSLCSYPPDNLVDVESDLHEDFTRWFEKAVHGWRVKSHEAPCYGCGPPWYLFNRDRKGLRRMIKDIEGCYKSTPAQKSFRCYREAIVMTWGVLGYQRRKRTGRCF